MRQIRTILVPVDFSPGSRAALDFGLQLARRFDASLWLLHAYVLPAYAFSEGVAIGPDLAENLANDARKGLERIREELQESVVPVSVASVAGSPAEVIVEWAQTHGVDLIVMGTHGRSGLKHLLAGSVAERVVRAAHCPVVTVRE
jgi:nucleotide-binding universal stress UspA family protein